MASNFTPIEFHNNQAPYVSDTNLNEMQRRLKGSLDTLDTKISNIKYALRKTATTQAWYRIATIYSSSPAKASIISVSTTWNVGQPSSVLFSCLTTYQKIKITQINAIAQNNSSVAITKLRALWDDSNSCYYIDAYYNYNTNNDMHVKNLSLLDSDYNGGVEINEPEIETFSGTSLSEITINYEKIEPFAYETSSYFINSWSTNGQTMIEVDEIGVKHITVSCRNGTDRRVMQLPAEFRPRNTVLLPASNQTACGYISIDTSGNVGVSSNIFTSGSSNLIFSGSYI